MISKEKRDVAVQYANENMEAGLNCSESVLNALLRADALDLPNEMTAIATGLGGGGGLSGNTCGALNSALIALGSVWGRKNPYDMDAETRGVVFREKKMRRFNNLVDEFIQKFGTGLCSDICDKCNGYFNDERQTICEEMVPFAVDLAIKYINMDEEKADVLPYKNTITNWK